MIDVIKLLEYINPDVFYKQHVTPYMINTILKPVQKQVKQLVKEKYPYLKVTNIEEVMGGYTFDIYFGTIDDVLIYVYLGDDGLAVGTDLYGWDKSRDRRITVTKENAIEVIQNKIKLAIQHGIISPKKLF